MAKEPGHALRWDVAGARWWWSSSTTQAVHAWTPGAAAAYTSRLPDNAGLLAHCRSGRLLLGLSNGLCFAEVPNPGRARLRLWPLIAVDAAEPRTRICEGRTDQRGYLVFGTANCSDDQRPIGSFYQFSQTYGLRRLALPAVSQATSICFSGDGKQLFFADARVGRIFRCGYDADRARIGDIALFASLEKGTLPGGAVVDHAGCLWSAQADRLVQYDAEGAVIRRVHAQGGYPAFGGAQLDQLVLAGSSGLVRIHGTGATGAPDSLYDDVTGTEIASVK